MQFFLLFWLETADKKQETAHDATALRTFSNQLCVCVCTTNTFRTPILIWCGSKQLEINANFLVELLEKHLTPSSQSVPPQANLHVHPFIIRWKRTNWVFVRLKTSQSWISYYFTFVLFMFWFTDHQHAGQEVTWFAWGEQRNEIFCFSAWWTDALTRSPFSPLLPGGPCNREREPWKEDSALQAQDCSLSMGRETKLKETEDSPVETSNWSAVTEPLSSPRLPNQNWVQLLSPSCLSQLLVWVSISSWTFDYLLKSPCASAV